MRPPLPSGSGRDRAPATSQNHGLDVIGAALTSPVDAVNIGDNRLFWTADPTDPKFVQVGITINEHVVNIEAYDVPGEQLIAMAASIADRLPQ